MERKFKGDLSYKGEEVVCFLHKYQYNGTDAISVYLKDMSPYFVATICTDDILPKDCVIIKDYTENTGVYDWLAENNIIEKTNNAIQVGYTVCPIGKIIYQNFEEFEF